MADKEIKVAFPEEKLEALSFFMQQKNETVEAALQEYISRAYEKNVPTPVRLFMDRNDSGGQSQEGLRQSGAPDTATENGNGEETPSHQNQRERRTPAAPRPSRRVQRNQEQMAEPEAAAGQVADAAPGDGQGENMGMTMGM